jgi:hypothetical protein
MESTGLLHGEYRYKPADTALEAAEPHAFLHQHNVKTRGQG